MTVTQATTVPVMMTATILATTTDLAHGPVT
jgi:hypothetical protein